MARSRVKTWQQGDVLTASDLNTEIDNLNQTGVAFPLTENVSAAGYEVSNAKLVTLKQLNDNVVTMDNYASFAAAITAIGSTVTTLLINANVNVTANATVPSTCTLWFLGQGKLTVSVAVTCTINGPVVADLRQIFAGSGTVTLASNTKVSTVYPQWWGVVGDGSAADVAAIEATSAAAGVGGTITFPRGTNCLVASEVDLSVAGQKIIAYGAKLTKDATFTGSCLIRVAAENVTIEGLEIDGTDQADDGIITSASVAAGFKAKNLYIHDCAYGVSANSNSRIHIEGCRISSLGGYGIRAHNIADTDALSGIRILNNQIDVSDATPATSTQLCVLVRGTATYATTDVVVSGNRFIQCLDPTNSTPMGCEMRYVDGGTFSDNYSLNGSMLVSVALSSNVTVDGNVCDGATFYGIEVAGISPTGCFNVSVTGNTIHGRGRLNYGVGLQGTSASSGCTVSGNTIQGTTLYGVFVNSMWSHLAISGNRIDITASASSQYGIYLLGGATPIDHAAITGNTLTGNGVGEKAIHLLDVRYATVSGNTLSNWTENGVFVRSLSATCDEISIVGNTINGLSSTAIGKSGTLGSRVMSAFNPPYRQSGTTVCNDINLESNIIEAWGTGTPEGSVTAGVSSVYHRTNGGATTCLYIKESGTGNTGWVAK